MRLLKIFFLEHRLKIANWFFGVLLVFQVLNLHSYVALNVDHQAIVATNDDDASWNIAIALKTRWWKDNGWVLYGPAYFRLSHSLQYFWGRTAELNPVTEREVWEKTVHHAITAVSLMSVVGIALLLAVTLVPIWWMRFALTMALLSAFLSSSVWAEFVLRAHPDHLFTFVIMVALFFTVRSFDSPGEPIWRRLAAIFWGVSVSVKMTVTLCLPGFILLFVPPSTRERWLAGLRFLGVMLLAYFWIGFPQTIVLDRPFRGLSTINALSVAPTMASTRHWFQVYGQEVARPLFVLLLAWLCFPRQKARPLDRVAWWRLTAFVGLPFLLLLSKNMLVPSDHYSMPFIGLLLLWLAFNLGSSSWLTIHRYSLVRTLVFCVVCLGWLGTTPQVLQAELEKRLQCRDEAREIYQRVVEYYAAGERIWVDPYVPYVTKADKKRLELSWEKTWSGYDRGGWTVLALNKEFRERFTTGDAPSTYTQTDIPAWPAVREFYLHFKDGDVAKTPSGQIFRKEFHNSCGHELWILQKVP